MPDGSSDPPGDQLLIDVLFYPGETAIDLEIRPLAALIGENTATESRVRTSGRHRDAQGRYVLRVRLPKGDTAISTATTKVAYADLDLANGTYKFGYQITGSSEGRVAFTAISDTTRLRVSDETRMLTPSREVHSESVDEIPLLSVVPDPQADGGYRILETVRRDRNLDVEREPTDLPPVAISRGFRRQAEYAAVFQPPEATPLEAEVGRLAAGGWVPRPSQAIYFATNRNVVDANNRTTERFGDTASDTLKYGSLRVNVPAEHTIGRLEQAHWWERNDPRRHFFVDAVNSLDRNAFWGALRPALSDNSTDVLLYVHGFNTTFEFAALRLAQFKNDIQFGGPALFFSWPSAGSVSDYRADERQAAASEEALTTVLRGLVEECRAGRQSRKVHLVAHSMGNRVLLGALERLAADLRGGEKPFGHLVLAAPDVDVRTFLALLPKATQGVDTVSLYFNKDDRALQISRGVHIDSRVGEGAVFLPPLLNIDARRANTSALGHDLFVSRDVVLVDLEMLLNLDLPPASRPTLRPAVERTNSYWMFP